MTWSGLDVRQSVSTLCLARRLADFAGIGNESVPKIIINETVNLFFFKLQSAFWQFQTIAITECFLICLLYTSPSPRD